MFVEHEVITNVADEPTGHSLQWVCRFVRKSGRDDPLVMLREMTRAGYLMLADERGEPLPRWQLEAVFRSGDERSPVRVVATDAGIDWGYR